MADPSTDAAACHLSVLTERMRQTQADARLQEPVAVSEVVDAVLEAMTGRLSPTEANLLREVAGLGRIIEQVKSGIAEVSVDAIRGSHIPSASVELDAIVTHTAEATDRILAVCESLDVLVVSLPPEQAAVVQAATTSIYEACSFQDITGQRIMKIVKALQAIEAKVHDLSMAYALSALPEGAAAPADPVPMGDASLLNGPALPAQAMDQSDIDKLMADF